MRKATVMYLLNEEGRKKSILAGGNGRQVQVLEVDANEDILSLGKVDRNGNITLQIGFDSDKLRANWSGGDRLYSENSVPIDAELREGSINWNNRIEPYRVGFIKDLVEFKDVQNIESLILWEKNRIQRLREIENSLQLEIDNGNERLEKEYKVKMQELEEKKKQEEEEKLKRLEEKQKQEEIERLEKERLENEKAEWIKEHGSDYLKNAHEQGFNCQRKYALERAEKEHPGFILDFNDTAGWESRSCPSEENLIELMELRGKGIEVGIVWLTAKPTYNVKEDDEYDYYCEEFEPREAIVIRKFLGGYDLVKY